MNRVLSMLLDAAIAAVMLIPLFVLLNKVYFHNTKRSALYLLFAIYLCGMFAVVGLPDICYVRFDPNFNFIPFAYMFSDAVNSLLNVALFFPWVSVFRFFGEPSHHWEERCYLASAFPS